MNDKPLRVLASIGLAVGGLLGMAGTFAPSASLRGVAWGIDGVALVMASALLTLRFNRIGQDIVAAGFLVFAVGEGVILSGVAIDLAASVPSFGAGAGLWSMALVLISVPRYFPPVVRLLGLVGDYVCGHGSTNFRGSSDPPNIVPNALLRLPCVRRDVRRLDLDSFESRCAAELSTTW